MRRSRLLVLALLAAVALIAIPVVISQAAKTEGHDVDATIIAARVNTLDGCKFAGYAKGEPFGRGAALLSGLKDRCDGTITKLRVYDKRGSLAGRADLVRTPRPDGKFALEGEVRFTSGTGGYKRAQHFTGQASGVYDQINDYLQLHISGK
jgi:hypothetical protein